MTDTKDELARLTAETLALRSAVHSLVVAMEGASPGFARTVSDHLRGTADDPDVGNGAAARALRDLADDLSIIDR